MEGTGVVLKGSSVLCTHRSYPLHLSSELVVRSVNGCRGEWSLRIRKSRRKNLQVETGEEKSERDMGPETKFVYCQGFGDKGRVQREDWSVGCLVPIGIQYPWSLSWTGFT